MSETVEHVRRKEKILKTMIKITYQEEIQKPFTSLKVGQLFVVPILFQTGPQEDLYLKVSDDETANSFCLTKNKLTDIGEDAVCVLYEGTLKVWKGGVHERR